jgi:RimJ/RimL family protein N-acetyltransferase
MNYYKILNNQEFTNGSFSIIPIRYKDRLDIMKWRNEQIYHLRQKKVLTINDQENYFNKIINKLFYLDQPGQILFSFLKDGICIGYGGLVHINWIDKNAEISFIMNTALEKEYFQFHWKTYLVLIEKVAFEELNMHKIFTYAYDIRPNLYLALESSGYKMEAILKEHCLFDDKYIDVVIHSKINSKC